MSTPTVLPASMAMGETETVTEGFASWVLNDQAEHEAGAKALYNSTDQRVNEDHFIEMRDWDTNSNYRSCRKIGHTDITRNDYGGDD